jgi:hypothetical protein
VRGKRRDTKQTKKRERRKREQKREKWVERRTKIERVLENREETGCVHVVANVD